MKNPLKDNSEIQESSEDKKHLFSFKAVKDFLDDFFDKQLDTLKDIFSSKKEDETKEKFNTLASELDRISPIIEEAGYVIRETRMSIGLPPFVELYLYKSKDHTKKSFDELIEENKEDKAVSMVLKTLKGATKLQSKARIGDQVFQEIILTLSVPPRISARYVHEDFDFANEL